jgi:hypothetical protein
MSDRVILHGTFRIVVTDGLKRLLNQLVQRRFPDLGDDKKKSAAQDKRHREMREMKYQKKYGPRGPGLILISTVSPNLIYSKEPRHG